MPNKLERIQVSGFKSIRELDIELHDLNVLIGANGSGKSNFIAVFRLLNMIVERRLQLYATTRGVDSLLYYGRKRTQNIRITITLSGVESDSIVEYRINLHPSENDELLITHEWFHEHKKDAQTDTHTWGDTRSHSAWRETQLYEQMENDNSGVVQSVIEALSSWKIYHFHDTSATSTIKARHDIHDNRYLKNDASNLAPYLYLLKQKYPQHYQRIVKTIRFVAPFFDDFILEPLQLNEEQIRLEWRDTQSLAMTFSAHDLSDGTLRFICLVTLLLQPHLPSIILIDEPELGLHPFAIKYLVELLQSVATQTQVIVTTQSTTLVNQFASENIIVVDRKNGQSTFDQLDTAQLTHWFEEYGLGDLWEKNVIGGTPQRETPMP